MATTVDPSAKAAETKEAKRPSRKHAVPELIFGDLWEYDPAPETAAPNIRARYDLFIGGRFVAPQAGEYFASINPATEERVAEIALASSADVDSAYVAAQMAYETTWRDMPGRERGKYIYRIARLLQDRAREFAVAETIDGGKPIRESRDFDVPMAAAHFFYHAGWADKLAYAAPGRTPQPLGVVGQVIPWNFPLLMLAWKLAPALATGNCVVLKPAETTSVTALKLAELLQEAGLPDGVVNIVTGAGETGAAVVGHPAAKKIAFTGSTEVGKIIMRQLAERGTKMTMELGGKAANIVFEDAPIDQAVEGVINGIFFNQGHVCCAGSRLLVQESIADAFVAKLQQRMASLRVGDPLDKNT
ncbi:MAG TPA: aldehyde dehydrogenase family protein, partial [Candidatus Elarobacter sp.]|nr:aldehyde dehydrogenase family protein [Candidatus Elarobacter sp.]